MLDLIQLVIIPTGTALIALIAMLGCAYFGLFIVNQRAQSATAKQAIANVRIITGGLSAVILLFALVSVCAIAFLPFIASSIIQITPETITALIAVIICIYCGLFIAEHQTQSNATKETIATIRTITARVGLLIVLFTLVIILAPAAFIWFLILFLQFSPI